MTFGPFRGRPGDPTSPRACSGDAVHAVPLTVSKSFSLPVPVPNSLFAAIPGASGNAGAIITGTSSLPIRFTRRFAEAVRRSDVRRVFEGVFEGDCEERHSCVK